MNEKEVMERLTEMRNAEDEITPIANAITNLIKMSSPEMQKVMLSQVGDALSFADMMGEMGKSGDLDEWIKEKMRKDQSSRGPKSDG